METMWDCVSVNSRPRQVGRVRLPRRILIPAASYIATGRHSETAFWLRIIMMSQMKS